MSNRKKHENVHFVKLLDLLTNNMSITWPREVILWALNKYYFLFSFSISLLNPAARLDGNFRYDLRLRNHSL